MGKAIIINGIDASNIGIGQVTFGVHKYWAQGLGDTLRSISTANGFSNSYRIFYGSSYGRGSSYFQNKEIYKINCVNGNSNAISLIIGECDTDGTNPTPLATLSDVASGFNSLTLQAPISIGIGKTLYIYIETARGIDNISTSVSLSSDIKGIDIINTSTGVVSNYPNSTIAIDFEVSE